MTTPPNEPDDDAFDALVEASSLGSPRVVAAVGELTEDQRTELARARFTRELDFLLDTKGKTGGQLRRIAELTELLYSEETSYYWWIEAAAADDPAAAAVVEDLGEESPDEDPTNAGIIERLRALARMSPCTKCSHPFQQHQDAACFLCKESGAAMPYHEDQPKED